MTTEYLPIFEPPSAVLQLPHEISATAKYPLGARLESRDGRLWRYAKAGATQLNPGLMGQMTPPHANVDGITQTGMSSNIGDLAINVLLTTGHGYVAGDFAEGWLNIEDGTGAGYRYRIKYNTVVTGDTVHRLELHEPIVVATDATSVIAIVPNEYSKVIVRPTTLTGMCVGVAPRIVTAANYYWAQRRGPCSVLVDAGDTIVVGGPVGKPGTDAAAGTFGVVANDGTNPVWGVAVNVAAATKRALVHLTLE